MSRQAGFSIIEVVIVIVVVAVIALLGFKAWDAWEGNRSATESSDDASQVADTATVPEVNSAADLDKVSTLLDETKVEDDTLDELDSETTF